MNLSDNLHRLSYKEKGADSPGPSSFQTLGLLLRKYGRSVKRLK